MIMTQEPNFITPAELMERYPNTQKFGWTSLKLEAFSRAGLLHYITPEDDLCKILICENSFLGLIKFTENVNSKRNDVNKC